MKNGYSMVYWNEGRVYTYPYSREELVRTLRGYRRDGMRGRHYTYSPFSAHPNLSVKQKAFGWLISNPSSGYEVFIKRDDAPF